MKPLQARLPQAHSRGIEPAGGACLPGRRDHTPSGQRPGEVMNAFGEAGEQVEVAIS